MAVSQSTVMSMILRFFDDRIIGIYQLLSQKDQANGYAGLTAGGLVAAGQAPAKAVYAVGGAQALVPSTDLNVRGFTAVGEITANGALQATPHGLGGIPTCYGISVTELPAGLAAGYDAVIAVDATNVSVTATNGTKYLPFAQRNG